MKTTKKDKVYSAIKSQIVKMDLKPGTNLSDRRIAQALKVSRTPVREALNLLQQEDYVVQNRDGGFSVKSINLKEIDDMYDVREALEIKALKISYGKDFSQKIEALSRMVADHADRLRKFNPGNRFLEGADFHKALVRMSENSYLIKVVESIYERLERLHYIENLSPEHADKAHAGHAELIDLLEKQRYSEAEALLSEHILDSKKDYVDRLKSRFEIRYY